MGRHTKTGPKVWEFAQLTLAYLDAMRFTPKQLLLTLSIALVLGATGAGTASASLLESVLKPAPRPTPATLPTDDEIYAKIEELVSHGPRRVGTPGGEFAVNFVESHLRDYGLSGVTVDKAVTYAWEAESHSLAVDGTAFDAFPVAYSQSPTATYVGTSSTPTGGLTAPLIDAGRGSASDVEKLDVNGKIVVFDLRFLAPLVALLPVTEYLYDPNLSLLKSPDTLLTANPYITSFTDAVKAAQDGGAVGFVGILADYFDSNQYYNELYRKLNVRMPGLWVTAKEGARIRSQVAGRSRVPATINLRTKRWKADANSVYGYLPGQSKDTILIQSHHDSVFQGAVEDASGTAEVLALAEHFSQIPISQRRKSLMFMTTDSHFSGYQSHIAFTKKHILQRDPSVNPYRIVADVSLEHVGKAATKAPDGTLRMSELPEPRGVFENVNPILSAKIIQAVRRNDMRRTAILTADALQPVGMPTDASAFFKAGIPTVSLIAGPLYLYDAADTLDKVAKNELQRVARTFSEIVEDLDDAEANTIGNVPLWVSMALGNSLLKAEMSG